MTNPEIFFRNRGDATFEAALYRISMTVLSAVIVGAFGLTLRVLRPCHRNM